MDNAAGISFQKSTCASSKFGVIFDNRVDFIRELKDETAVEAVQVDTVKNVAGLFTKCLSVSVRQCLFKQIVKNEFLLTQWAAAAACLILDWAWVAFPTAMRAIWKPKRPTCGIPLQADSRIC